MDWKPNLTHVLQILIIVGGVAAFIFTFEHQSQSDFSTLMVRQGTMDTRLTNVEQQILDRNRLDEQFAADTRSSLEHISEGLSDLRVQLAKMPKTK